MATLIDTLIVSLQLDPKGFNASQKNSVAALNSLEQNARGIQQTLNNLSSQSRRTGSSIAAGASAGALGLRNLAVAGVEAYAAFKTLEGIIGQVTNASQRGAKLSRDAWALGIPTQQLDTMKQAAYETAHIPQDTFVSSLDAYQQRIEENKRTGAWANEFTQAQMLGIHTNAPVLQQIKEIRAALQGKQGPETENWVNAMGLAPLLHWLKLSEAQVNAAEKISARHALTPEQGKELERLQNAAAKYEDSMVHLWETLAADFSKSGLSQALEGFSALTDSVSHNETAMKALEVATGVVAAGSVITLASALWKLVAAMNGVWAAPLMRLLTSGGFARFLGPVGAAIATMWPSPAGNQSEIDAEKKLFDESKRRNGVTSTPGASGSSRNGASASPASNKWINQNAPFPTLNNGIRADSIRAPTAPEYAAGIAPPGWTNSAPKLDPSNPSNYGPGSPLGQTPPVGVGPMTQRQSALSTIRASASASGSTTSGYDIDTNIGQIVIHPKSSDATGMHDGSSNAIHAALIRKNTMISSANSGMDG